MSRVKRGVTKHARHKKVIDAAKGYRGRRKNTFRIANQAVEKAGQYAYIGRKLKKRQFRALWIQRINAAARLHGMTYGRFMDGLNKAGINLDRKVLADMAGNEPEAFKALVETAKKHASAPHTVAGGAPKPAVAKPAPKAKPKPEPEPEPKPKATKPKPKVLYTDGPTDGDPDDLKKIKGIGPKFEGDLNNKGVYYFRQIAAWKAKDIEMVDKVIDSFPGRIERDEWVKQAGELAKD